MGVADPREFYRKRLQKEHNIPEANVFKGKAVKKKKSEKFINRYNKLIMPLTFLRVKKCLAIKEQNEMM